ncbi:MAG: type IX secretion system outer membrane channel protein PorV [Prevotellaceae bacterium]|nr:type IX secretion system outer membrane channel protein PorV [Prevotellaceae bacterium]
MTTSDRVNRLLFVMFCLALGFSDLRAQDSYKALFILDISPEARASGMGDVGVASSPDANSQHWNPSKYIFAEANYKASLSYMPWLSDITRGMNMGYFAGYAKFGERSAVGASVRYLNIGHIDLRSLDNTFLATISSNEYAIDVSYSHRLGRRFSGGIALRYASGIKVEHASGTGALRPASAFAGDVSFFYTMPELPVGKLNTELSFGTNLSNLGTKVKKAEGAEYFLPMNFRIGGTWKVHFDKRNTLSLSLDLNKSLVPTRYDSNYSVFEAIGKSFGKSAGDFCWGFGAEYCFARTLLARSGYHNSKEYPGYRYFTFGIGLMYGALQLDASYLISTSSVKNPLDNTFRITLGYAF